MDWSRAKSIMIVLLLAFNMFLLVNIITYARGQSIPGETIQNTIKILKSRGVELQCQIPGYKSDSPKLIYGKSELDVRLIAGGLLGVSYNTEENNGSVDHSRVYSSGSRKLIIDLSDTMAYEDSNPKDSPDITDRARAEEYIRDFVKDLGLIDSSYIVDSFKTNKDGSVAIALIEKYKGYLIFDNYLKATISKTGVTKLESGRKEIRGLTQVKTSDIAAAYQVLLGNFGPGSRTVITGIDFGYLNSNDARLDGVESVEQFPVWRIETAGSDVPRYFSTSEGQEIKIYGKDIK